MMGSQPAGFGAGPGQEMGFQTDLPRAWRCPEPGATLGKGRDSSEPPALAGSESGGPSLAGRWLLLCGPQAWVWPSAPHRSPHWLCVPQKPPGEKPGSPRPPRAAPPPSPTGGEVAAAHPEWAAQRHVHVPAERGEQSGRHPRLAGPPHCCGLPAGPPGQWPASGCLLPNLRPGRPAPAVQQHHPVPAG